MKLAYLVAASLLGACSFVGGSPADQVPADAGNAGSDDADPSSPDGGMTDDECGSPAVYVDEFDATAAKLFWNVLRPGDVNFDGALVIDPSNANSPAGVRSRHRVDVRGNHISLEVPQHFQESSNRTASFVLARSARTSFGFHMTGSNLRAEIALDGTILVNRLADLDRVAHRYLQIREDSGVLFFETSSDGVTWTEFASGATPAYAAGVRVQILAIDSNGNNDAIRIDGLNRGRVVAPWCKASSLQDAFDDGAIAPEWISDAADPLCAGNIETTSLTIGLLAGDGAGDQCQIFTAIAFDLAGDTAEVEVAPIGVTDFSRFIAANHESGAGFGMAHEPAGLCSFSFDSGGQPDPASRTCIDYQLENHWRIRSDGTDVFIEVSTDRAAWVPVHTAPEPFDLSAVQISMGSYSELPTVGGTHDLLGYNAP